MTMGISLHYETEASERAEEDILKEAAALQSARAWMSEPIRLLKKDGRLKGFSKFPPSSWATGDGTEEMTLRDWSFISWWDFRFILDSLARWSRQHEVMWKLSCEGDEVGQISEGNLDQSATEFLRQMADRGGASEDESSNQQRAAEIIRLYESSLE
jgi:hypothetical protein